LQILHREAENLHTINNCLQDFYDKEERLSKLLDEMIVDLEVAETQTMM